MADKLNPEIETNSSDSLPDFPNWEIPAKPQQHIALTKAHEEWLTDWRAPVASGEITLESLRNRQQPVPLPFEIWSS